MWALLSPTVPEGSSSVVLTLDNFIVLFFCDDIFKILRWVNVRSHSLAAGGAVLTSPAAPADSARLDGDTPGPSSVCPRRLWTCVSAAERSSIRSEPRGRRRRGGGPSTTAVQLQEDRQEDRCGRQQRRRQHSRVLIVHFINSLTFRFSV